MTEILRSYEPATVRETISRLRMLLEHRAIAQKEIVDATGIEKTRFSRWINGHTSWSAIGPSDYRKVIDFIAQRSLFVDQIYQTPELPGIEALAFHGMAKFFKVNQSHIESARKRLVGHYDCYRHSYYAAPDLLRGSLEILYDEENHCLKTIELNRIPKGILGADGRDIEFRREGFIWPTHLNMLMVISEKVQGRDIQVMYINRSLMNAISSEDAEIQTAEGVVLDWQGRDFYMTKIFLQKRSLPLPDENIGVLKEKDVPRPILSKLQEPFTGPHDFLKVYK